VKNSCRGKGVLGLPPDQDLHRKGGGGFVVSKRMVRLTEVGYSKPNREREKESEGGLRETGILDRTRNIH